jgi:hypothetical protein
MIASGVLIVYGAVRDEPSFIAMGIGVLGAPSISVAVIKNGDEDDADTTS